MRLETLHELFRERAASLEAGLAGCETAEAAAACAAAFLGALREAYVAQLDEASERQRASELLIACQSASGLMAGMTEADVHLKLPGPEGRGSARARRALREVRRYAPALLCAVLGAYLLLRGELPAAIFAGIAAAAGLFLPTVKAPAAPLPEARAVPRPDPRETARRMERLLRDADALLFARETGEASAPVLTGPVLESIQMLCEASLAGDGAFALRAASPLAAALEAQGVELMLLGADNAGWFDLLPGAPAGRTIRPALVKDGHLLARGQAIAR